jgi:hypothetical protein
MPGRTQSWSAVYQCPDQHVRTRAGDENRTRVLSLGIGLGSVRTPRLKPTKTWSQHVSIVRPDPSLTVVLGCEWHVDGTTWSRPCSTSDQGLAFTVEEPMRPAGHFPATPRLRRRTGTVSLDAEREPLLTEERRKGEVSGVPDPSLGRVGIERRCSGGNEFVDSSGGAVGYFYDLCRIAVGHLVCFELIAVDNLDPVVAPADHVKIQVDRDASIGAPYVGGADVDVDLDLGTADPPCRRPPRTWRDEDEGVLVSREHRGVAAMDRPSLGTPDPVAVLVIAQQVDGTSAVRRSAAFLGRVFQAGNSCRSGLVNTCGLVRGGQESPRPNTPVEAPLDMPRMPATLSAPAPELR